MYQSSGLSLRRLIVFLFCAGMIFPAFAYAQSSASLQEQMDVLEKEINDLDKQLDATEQEKETLTRQIKIFDAEIKKKELELKRLGLAIKQATADIKRKDTQIGVLSGKISRIRTDLQANVLLLYRQNTSSLIEALLSYSSLSQFFSSLNQLENVQAEIQNSLSDLRGTKKETEEARNELQEFKEGQEALRALQELERVTIERNKKEKDELLRVTKGKEALFQQILTQKKKNLAALKNQLFYLEKTGVSAEDALKYAKLAADRVGIRPEFLLALLEVESGKQYQDGVISAGTYVGTGNWKTDMYDCYINLGKRATAENQKAAFFEITSKLGYDADRMPVSRRPYYGCGGAMGAAQFIPTTWLLFEDRVSRVTGHNPPNPWDAEDAFTAAAIFLADSGATSKTEAGEKRAAQTYISGRPSCPSSGSARTACLGYSRQVLSLSREISRNIN